MAGWDRRTPWRQGHVLAAETVIVLHLVPDVDLASTVVVVVSHDCDLAQDPGTEPSVEVIVGRRVNVADGNFTHGKNPRRLHLSAVETGAAMCVELTATARQSIPKEHLARHLPNATISIDAASRNTLQRWLAARYRRSAFPDDFDNYLVEKDIPHRLARILGPQGNHIVAVFFDVDEGGERAHESADDPFTLSIDLLYSTDTDPVAAEAAATKAAVEITPVFRERYFNNKAQRWSAIELLHCTPISDEALTYAMSLRLKRWNGDYISLRADPVQPMVVE
jgi:hypothetical protein